MSRDDARLRRNRERVETLSGRRPGARALTTDDIPALKAEILAAAASSLPRVRAYSAEAGGEGPAPILRPYLSRTGVILANVGVFGRAVSDPALAVPPSLVVEVLINGETRGVARSVGDDPEDLGGGAWSVTRARGPVLVTGFSVLPKGEHEVTMRVTVVGASSTFWSYRSWALAVEDGTD